MKKYYFWVGQQYESLRNRILLCQNSTLEARGALKYKYKDRDKLGFKKLDCMISV